LPEIYLTSQADNKLQTLAAGPTQPTYRDIALKRGVLGTRPVNGGDPLPSTAWHPAFEDVNNDGFIDLYVSKGNVAEQQGYATRDPSNLYIGQPDGTFVEQAEAAGIVNYDRGRGSALVDLDLDGLLDLVEVKLDAPVRVWRNLGAGTGDEPVPMGRWLGIVLRQEGSNRDAIGAVVEVAIGDALVRREVVVGGGHISGQRSPVHVGLGDAGQARVRVTWPDGEQGPWLTVDADRTVFLERGAADVTPIVPAGG
ncbi:MAG TPA: ASPIC/UnbV domain-containing protein, partial [Candidatus Limnocylindrales bacterium]|nr:ASPIC/UnbV domain-containing protein [Candidatus Limnocylindrales bacterium]